MKTMKNLHHPVEVKIWELKNSVYIGSLDWRKYRRFSVFVGAVPRTCTAEALANAFEEVIGNIVYCGIELDRYTRYPKGAACIIFSNKESYIKAIAAHEIVLGFGNYERRVEVKAFLASNMPCEKCGFSTSTKFCGEMICLSYYCNNCWKLVHSARPSMATHTPLKKLNISWKTKLNE